MKSPNLPQEEDRANGGTMRFHVDARFARISLAATVIGLLPGCGLFKLGNAINPNAPSVVGQFAQFVQPQSNVTRSSGDATYAHLQALFPTQLQSKLNYLNPINFDPPGGLQQACPSPIFGCSVGNAPESYGSAIFEFNSMTATGTFGALGSSVRPATISGQSALGQYVGQLCAQDTDLNIYSTQGILMPGESLPSDPNTQMAFAVARNAWLYPYAADSPEVQALVQFYQNAQALASTPSGQTQAANVPIGTQPIPLPQLWLCQLALSSAPFWMGSGEKGDEIRRLALELGRRAPTFMEYWSYFNGSMTLDQYTQQLEGEPGFIQSVLSWHQQSLDLFTLDGGGLQTSTGMAIPGNWTGGSSGTAGVDLEYEYVNTSGASNASQYPNGLDLLRYPGQGINVQNSEYCSQDPTQLDQPFDPRTTMILWQQKDLTSAQWVTLGAWVMGSYLSQYTQATGLSTSLCTLVDPNGIWYLCNGQYTDGSVLHLSDVRNTMQQSYQFVASPASDPEPAPPSPAAWMYYCYVGSGFPAGLQCFHMQDDQPSYVNGVYTAGQYDERRLRRFAPTGEQNGYSTVNLWLNNQPIKVCNVESRYFASCFYRPIGPHWSGGNFSGAINGWNAETGSLGLDSSGNFDGATALATGWSPLAAAVDVQPYDPVAAISSVGGYYGYSNYVPVVSSVNASVGVDGDSILLPSILAEMRCGQPNLANLGNLAQKPVPTSNAATAEANGTLWTPAQQHAADLTVYPYGYPNDGATGFTGDGTPLNTLTVQISIDFAVGGGDNGIPYPLLGYQLPYLSRLDWQSMPDAYLAMNRLRHDVSLEPYRLLNDIVSNDKDYRLLVTADYTFGGKELELAYRTQGWNLPAYPPGYTPPAFNPQPSQGNHTSNNPALSGTPAQNFNYANSTDSPWDDTARIQIISTNSSRVSSPIQPIPFTWTQSSWSLEQNFTFVNNGGTYDMIQPMWLNGYGGDGYGGGNQYYYLNGNVIPPKKMSGVLTMPAFINPAYGSDSKMRTLISRYFNMLLCGDPTIVQLTPSQQAFQTQYIPQISHRDKAQGCFQCHVNVDPLASALSLNFTDPNLTGQPSADGMGEGIYMSEGQRWTGQLSTGALMGQQVSGVEQVGQVLANSPQFAACAVQTAFQGIYGRAPAFADAQSVNAITQKFMNDGYSYKQMIRDLVNASGFSSGN